MFVLCETLRRACGFKWLRGMTLLPVGVDRGRFQSDKNGGLATAKQLLALENLAEADLPPEFIRAACDRGDWC